MKMFFDIFPLGIGLFAVLLTSCSSSKVIKYPFEKVCDAAKEQFAVNTWTKNGTHKSSTEEKPGKYLYIKYYEWEYPDIKIKCEVEVEPEEDGSTDLSVFVRDYDSWLAPLIYHPGKARKVISAFEQRMKSRSWGPMPWRKDMERIESDF